MQYLSLIRLVLSLLPVLIDAIKAIEAAFPASGQGSLKLELVRGVVEQAYNAGTGALSKFEDVWPVLQKVIASLVTFMNTTGIFKK